MKLAQTQIQCDPFCWDTGLCCELISMSGAIEASPRMTSDSVEAHSDVQLQEQDEVVADEQHVVAHFASGAVYGTMKSVFMKLLAGGVATGVTCCNTGLAFTLVTKTVAVSLLSSPVGWVVTGTIAALYGVSAIRDSRLTVRARLAAGVGVQTLLSEGVSIAQLLEEGVELNTLLAENVSVGTLLAEGVEVRALLAENVSAGLLIAEEVSVATLLEAGAEVRMLLAEKVSVGTLLAEGVTVQMLLAEDVGIATLLREGVGVATLLREYLVAIAKSIFAGAVTLAGCLADTIVFAGSMAHGSTAAAGVPLHRLPARRIGPHLTEVAETVEFGNLCRECPSLCVETRAHLLVSTVSAASAMPVEAGLTMGTAGELLATGVAVVAAEVAVGAVTVTAEAAVAVEAAAAFEATVVAAEAAVVAAAEAAAVSQTVLELLAFFFI